MILFFGLLASGFVIAVGIVLGLFSFFFLVLNGKNDEPKPENLLKPFNNYLQDIISSDRFEEIEEVVAVINCLEKSSLPENFESWNIKKDSHVELDTSQSKTKIRVVKTYKVIGKK